MVMGISALTRQSVFKLDAKSSETADAGPFSVIKHEDSISLAIH